MTFKENHVAITHKQTILELLQSLNEKMHSAGLYFKADIANMVGYSTYQILPANTLIALASYDFAYYHEIEFAFHGIIANDLPDDDIWPDNWEKEQLRLLENEERKTALELLKCNDKNDVFVFAFRRGSFTDINFFIAAKGISVSSGTVFYYNRLKTNNLETGERVGWWIEP